MEELRLLVEQLKEVLHINQQQANTIFGITRSIGGGTRTSELFTTTSFW